MQRHLVGSVFNRSNPWSEISNKAKYKENIAFGYWLTVQICDKNSDSKYKIEMKICSKNCRSESTIEWRHSGIKLTHTI